MFSLSISFGPGPTTWRLMFHSEEAAQRAWDTVAMIPPPTGMLGAPQTRVVITDDFGQRLCLSEFAGMLLEDLNQTKVGHTEFAIHEMKTRAGIATRAQADPILRQAQANGGPPMLHQMPMMR